MPEPIVTTNPADYKKLENVYISPKDPPPFVAEVSINAVGIFGTTIRGPIGKSVTIRSPKEFKSIFGTDRHAAGGGDIVSELWKALMNKKFGVLQVYRVAAAAAVKASFTLEDTAAGAGTAIVRIDAMSPGVYGNDVFWKVEDATDADADHWNLRLKYKGEEFLYENLDTSATGNDNTLTVIGTGDSRLIDLVKLADGRPFTSIASGDGADADGFTALGQTVAAFTSVAGTDGTIASSDYVGSGGALDTLAAYKGLGVVFCANEDATITAAVNAQMLVKAAASSDRMFPIHDGALTGTDVGISAIEADVANFRSDRIAYCHNAAYTRDQNTGSLVLTSPVSWMACILANTDVDIHPGEEVTHALLAGIDSLDATLEYEDYVALKAAGVCSLERQSDGSFEFVSGVTTSLTSGKTEITRRRMADFIQLSLAKFAKPFVKKRGTEANDDQFSAGVEGWLDGLQGQERVVKASSVDMDSVNSDEEEAQGIKYIAVDVKLINHWLHVVLLTDIGTGVVIEQS